MSPFESFCVSSRRATSRSITGSCTEPPAAAGRLKRPSDGSAMSGSPGCQKRRKPTIAAVLTSAATMSVSSTDR